MNIANHEIQPAEEKRNRPWVITTLCVIGFLFRLQMLGVVLFYFMLPDLPHEGRVMMYSFLFIYVSEMSGLIGYWKMRRWGIFLYSVGSVGGIILGFLFKWHPTMLQYAVSTIFISIGIFYWKRMR